MKHSIYLIVAVDEQNGIGKHGKLPWHYRSDMAFFKEITTRTDDHLKQNMVIMGRKTWESLPKKFRPLPKRKNVVVTHSTDYSAKEATVHHSLEKALKSADKSTEKVFIIGGAEIFKQALEMNTIKEIYLTRIHKNHHCDTFLPSIEVTKIKKIKTITEKGVKIDFLSMKLGKYTKVNTT